VTENLQRAIDEYRRVFTEEPPIDQIDPFNGSLIDQLWDAIDSNIPLEVFIIPEDADI